MTSMASHMPCDFCSRSAENTPMLFRSSLWALVLLFAATFAVQAEIVPDLIVGTDPAFADPEPVKDFKRDFKSIWRLALRRPEADYQQKAAETIARAYRYGVPGMPDLVPELENILTADKSHPTARYSAANTLIVLESKGSAPKLLEASQKHGADLRQLIEPTLAKWDFAPAREIWTKRLEEKHVFPRDLILALRGLAIVGESAAVPSIVKISTDILRPAHIRLEAARAAGQISDSGLESDAATNAQETRMNPQVNRLCAAYLLQKHSSDPARKLLLEFAVDKDPSLAALALARLNEIDPELVVPIAISSMKNADPKVREQGAICFLKLPQPDRILPLAELLADDNPVVRKLVGENFVRLADEASLNRVIRFETMRILAGERWQGQEQSALVLGSLNHGPAAARLVELLESTRPEVMIHTAWALRKLADEDTIPAIVDKIGRQTTERRARTIPGVDEQVAHLFEACGRMKAKAAEPLMMAYVPKNRRIDISRSSAIWALGQLFEGTPNEKVSDALMGRILDDDPQNPENPFIKQASVVSLVKMKEVDRVTALQNYISKGTPYSAVGLAIRWALQELGGVAMPEPTPDAAPEGEWFLEPLGDSFRKKDN